MDKVNIEKNLIRIMRDYTHLEFSEDLPIMDKIWWCAAFVCIEQSQVTNDFLDLYMTLVESANEHISEGNQDPIKWALNMVLELQDDYATHFSLTKFVECLSYFKKNYKIL